MFIKSICVYCGSLPGNSSIYQEQAREFGKLLAKNNIRLIYGGGCTGIMGAVSQGVLDNGGLVTGIIPQFLVEKESNQKELEKLNEHIVTQNMHQRKAYLFEKADAFVTFPGGIGTLEEIFETYTLAQLNQHTKPMIFANIDNFWQPMADLLDTLRQKQFIPHRTENIPVFIENIHDILPTIRKLLNT